MADAVTIRADLNEARAFMKDIDKNVATALRKNIRQAVAASGSELVADMQRRAAWSTRIPGAIAIKTSFSETKSNVKINVDHNAAPHARPIELGNSANFTAAGEAFINANGGFKIVNGKRYVVNRKAFKALKAAGVGTGRVLRHPVFHKNGAPGGWSTMALRPFFFAATDAGAKAVTARMEKALDAIAAEVGFKGV